MRRRLRTTSSMSRALHPSSHLHRIFGNFARLSLCSTPSPHPRDVGTASVFSAYDGRFLSRGGSGVTAASVPSSDESRSRCILRRSLQGGAAVSSPASSDFQSGVPKENVDCVVIGAGVVGLAIARELALNGRDVIVLEAAEGIGTGTSSRNSEVIHAGLYYPPGSLKARLCVEGKHALYAYCKEREIPHDNKTKLIVATGTDQIPVLEKLEGFGKKNSVNDLYMIEGKEAMQLEPSLQCVKALMSPSTGLVDSHAFMLALQTDAEQMGVMFAFNTVVTKGSISNGKIEIGAADMSPQLATSEASESMILSAKSVVNAAGLFAQSIARRIKDLSSETIPKAWYVKGCYFTLSGISKPPFSRLIYPVPEVGGFGIHVTMDLGGQTKFGPDVEWLPELNDDVTFPALFDYVVDPARGDKFYAEIRKYYPDLPDGSLQPGYSGFRTKTAGRGEPPGDFIIQGASSHGVPGLVQLYGIESPGLTSSLAIAKLVGKLVKN